MLGQAELNVAAMMKEPDFVDLGLGIRRVAPWVDFGRLFSYRLCNTDSTRASRVDYNVPQVALCVNFLADEEALRREVVSSLVKVHDYLRNKRVWETCDKYACAVVRATLMSGMCRQSGSPTECLTRVVEDDIAAFPGCERQDLHWTAREAFQRCHMDRSPLGLI